MQIYFTPRRKFDEHGKPAQDYHASPERGIEVSIKPQTPEDQKVLDSLDSKFGEDLTSMDVTQENKNLIKSILNHCGYASQDEAVIHACGGERGQNISSGIPVKICNLP